MSLSKFLDPKNDYAFKRIFGSERNKDILIHFLNDIFSRGVNPIEDVTFLKSHQDPEVASHRASIVDILCQDTYGERFVVEMQVAHEKSFVKRAQYYAAKAYIGQRGKDSEYKDLKQVTFLAILDFILFPEKTAYLSHHQILDTATFEHDLTDFSFSFLELSKFTKPQEKLNTMIEKWAYFFKHASATSEKELNNITGDDMIIMRAYEELNRFSWSDEELRTYDAVDMKKWSNQNVLETAFEKGMQAGIEKGIEKGMEKGREEKEAALLQVAQFLKSQNMSIIDIVKATGLNLEILEDL